MSPEAAPRIGVVAGHDSSGGAGIDADREAAAAAGAEAVCVVTAWTRQEDGCVLSVEPRAAEDWLAEARALLEEPPAAWKSGLLAGADHVRAAARLAQERGEGVPWVVDPVLSASGGEVFLDEAGVEALLAELLPQGVVVTPNVPEAAHLTGREARALAESPDERLAAARELLERGACAVCLKGGHTEEDPVRDLVLERGAEPRWLEHARVPGGGLHGSGCRFAAHLAAGLACGRPLERAAAEAGRWVAHRIAAAERP